MALPLSGWSASALGFYIHSGEQITPSATSTCYCLYKHRSTRRSQTHCPPPGASMNCSIQSRWTLGAGPADAQRTHQNTRKMCQRRPQPGASMICSILHQCCSVPWHLQHCPHSLQPEYQQRPVPTTERRSCSRLPALNSKGCVRCRLNYC